MSGVAAALGDEHVVQAAGGRGVAEHRTAGTEKQVEHCPLCPVGVVRGAREQLRGAAFSTRSRVSFADPLQLGQHADQVFGRSSRPPVYVVDEAAQHVAVPAGR